jgi:hypothetical protein
MGVLFEDDFLDDFGTWPLAYIPYGGPYFGELFAVARTVGRGDADAYYAAWDDTGAVALGSPRRPNLTAELVFVSGHPAAGRHGP